MTDAGPDRALGRTETLERFRAMRDLSVCLIVETARTSASSSATGPPPPPWSASTKPPIPWP